MHICAGCGAAYAPDLPRCPQCQSVEWRPSYEEPGTVTAPDPVVSAPADPEAKSTVKPKVKPADPKWPGDGDG